MIMSFQTFRESSVDIGGESASNIPEFLIISMSQKRSIGIGKSRFFRWICQSNGSICGVLIMDFIIIRGVSRNDVHQRFYYLLFVPAC